MQASTSGLKLLVCPFIERNQVLRNNIFVCSQGDGFHRRMTAGKVSRKKKNAEGFTKGQFWADTRH